MKLKVIVHKAEEGGYWAEVPAILGCATQGESFEELLENLYEAVEACLSIELEKFHGTHIDELKSVFHKAIDHSLTVYEKMGQKPQLNIL
jgi:predicted RNase H-like HicB family nuclease